MFRRHFCLCEFMEFTRQSETVYDFAPSQFPQWNKCLWHSDNVSDISFKCHGKVRFRTRLTLVILKVKPVHIEVNTDQPVFDQDSWWTLISIPTAGITGRESRTKILTQPRVHICSGAVYLFYVFIRALLEEVCMNRKKWSKWKREIHRKAGDYRL